MAKTPTNAVAKPGASSVPAHLQSQVKADAGKGVSSSADDSLVPLIVVLQGQSPQTMKPKPEYIKGAEAGDIWLRSAPNPIIKPAEGALVQPCWFYKNVVEWIPRNPDGSGGGYVAEHPWSDNWQKADWAVKLGCHEVEDDEGFKRWMTKGDEHEFIETRNHAVIVYTEDGQALPYLIPLSSSGHSVSRQWMFMMRAKTVDGEQVPSWAVLYRLQTLMRTKGKNNWYVLDPKEGSDEGTLWATEEQYVAGKKLHEAFASGTKKADLAGASPETEAADGKTAKAKQHI